MERPQYAPKIMTLTTEIDLFPQRPSELLHTLLQHHNPIRKRPAEQTQLTKLQGTDVTQEYVS